MQKIAAFIDMDAPAQKEKFVRVCSEITDLLRKKTANPNEGYAVICLVKEALEFKYGFKGFVTYTRDQVGHT